MPAAAEVVWLVPFWLGHYLVAQLSGPNYLGPTIWANLLPILLSGTFAGRWRAPVNDSR